MGTRKYTSDFRLENIEKKGRLVTRSVYRGDWFEFIKPAEEIKKLRLLYGICSCASALIFIGTLFFNTACLRCIYVMLPFAALVFPLFFACASFLRLMTANGKVTREHCDKIERRYTVVSIFTICFSAFSLAGHIIFMINNGDDFTGILILVFTAIILACGILMFAARDGLKMHKIGSAKDGIAFYEEEKRLPEK